MMPLFLVFVSGLYAYIICRNWWYWQRLPQSFLPQNNVPDTFISVIIPVRNEEENICSLLQNLNTQTYPAALFEVLIVDDSSEDNTAALVQHFAAAANYSLKYLPLPALTSQVGKKAAVQAGIGAARGELLLFTDGDCRVQPEWLMHFEYIYREKQAKFISGPVFFQDSFSLFQKVQLVEFASLIGVGAASMAAGAPNMCNGANIAYPKSVFTAVNGFAGNEHIASGDDEFLLHKVHAQYPDAVFFLKALEATVYTWAKSSLRDFFAQRVRWASKWPAYQNIWAKGLALLVFSVNFSLFFFLALWLMGNFSGFVLVSAFVLKMGADLLFLKTILTFFRQQKYWPYIVPLQFVYIPYVVVTALVALRKTYNWKGRKIK